MTRAHSWLGRALALRWDDVRALRWARQALNELRPHLAEEGTRAHVAGPDPRVAEWAGRTVGLYLRARRATCFERTLILQSWLSAHGRAVPIAIGVSTDCGFRAHAWLVGVDSPSESEGYEEIKRVEAPPAAESCDSTPVHERTTLLDVTRPPTVGSLLVGQLRGAARDTTARRALRMSLPLMLGRPLPSFQPYNNTSDNRYPEIFAELSSERSDLTILSFGCSVGRELVTLRHYFPNARLIGVDASAVNIADARRLLADTGVTGVETRNATDVSWLGDACVDIIFAMAVFRHGALARSRPQSCKPYLRFESFDTCVADLVRCLRPGGSLVVEHSNFRISDTSSAVMLTASMSRPRTSGDASTPYYGPDNRLHSSPPEREIAFVKDQIVI